MARGDFPSSKQEQFVLRFPDGMRDVIRAEAEANNRSMNAEIVARLEESFDVKAHATSMEIEALVSSLLDELELVRNPELARETVRLAKHRFSYPKPDVVARMFLAGVPIREIDQASHAASALRIIKNLGANDRARFRGREAELQKTLEGSLRTILDYLRKAGWTVTPPTEGTEYGYSSLPEVLPRGED